MKIVFAADGSECTQRALEFLTAHDSLMGVQGDLFVLNVQPPFSSRVSSLVSSEMVHDYHLEEANKVLDPIKTFLAQRALRCRLEWVLGVPAQEIVNASKREGAQLILMGSHGRSLLGDIFIGSVAQRVLAESDVPVLLVK